jgi:hypothetical protein
MKVSINMRKTVPHAHMPPVQNVGVIDMCGLDLDLAVPSG